MLGIPAKRSLLSPGNFGKTNISHGINLIHSEIRKVPCAERAFTRFGGVLVSREMKNNIARRAMAPD